MDNGRLIQYLTKLVEFAADRGIEIRKHKALEAGRALFVVDDNAIYISPVTTNEQLLMVLLHELGHVCDKTLKRRSKIEAYHAQRTFTSTKRQDRVVMLSEIKAWNIGRMIAHTLDIPIDKAYSAEMQACLYSYRHKKGVAA